MIHREKIPPNLLEAIEKLPGTDLEKFEIPPPVFLSMKGEFVYIDSKTESCRCRFPVLKDQLNVLGFMQGGVISAAIDNTIGPLSMLIDSPSVTRKMELKYLKSIGLENEYIYVTARFIEKKKRFLFFEAIVEDERGDVTFAIAKSTHWII